MDRRNFLKQVFLWSAGLSVSVPTLTISSRSLASSPNAPLLVTGKEKDYAALIGRILDGLGGMSKFVSPGDKVVIKPNIGWDRNPEQAANTHPTVIKALAEHVLEAGASKILVFDRTCNEPRRCYVNSGIQTALESINSKKIKFFHPDQRKYIPVEIKQGNSVRRLSIYKDALEADRYINVPVAKHHGLSRLTLGLKNSMGVLGGDRGALHHDLGQKLADLATVVRPTLTIIDATRVLLRNGPQGGSLSDVETKDTIIASTDPVAADAYATTLFNLQPEEIESSVAAHKMGLGEINIGKMNVVKV